MKQKLHFWKVGALALLTLLAALPGVANAQSRTVEIGNWNATTSTGTGGFYFGSKYTWSQTLYLEDEIGGAGYIHQITFDNRSTAACTADSVKIYLGKTPMVSHPTAAVSTWVPMDSLTLVFRDTNWSVPAEVGDLTIVLDEPYYYDGNGTLAVVISKANSGTTSSNTKFGYTSTTAMGKYTGSTTVAYCRFPTVSGSNSAYKFNIRFGMTATEDEDFCPAVSNFHVAGRTSSSVTVAWNAVPGDTYEVGYTTANGTEIDITPTTVFVDSYTFDYLDESTPYKFYVRHVCDLYESEWKQLSTNTLAPPQQLPLTLDFEDDEDDAIWNTNNGSNGWYIDSLGTGRALFISNDEGQTNAYTLSTTQAISWAWVDVDLEEGGYRIAFDWKCYGESNYDYMRAFLVPASVEFDNGFGLFNTTSSTNARNVVPEGWILLGSKHPDSLYYNLRTTWQHVEYECTMPEGVYHLAFLWSNDVSTGNQPPAAIDNLSIIEVDCFAPLSYTIDTLSSTSSTVTMEINHPSASSFMVVWRPKGRTLYDTVEVTGDSYEFTNLAMGAIYEGYIYSLCSGDTSGGGLPFEFIPPCGTLTTNDLPYTETFEAYGSGAAYPINQCWHKGVEPIVGTVSTNYPYPNSSNAINGNRSLYFYAYRYGTATSTTTAYYNWMTLPMLDESLDVSDLMVEFLISRSASTNSSTYTYSTTLVVGVSSDITTDSAFVPVDTIDLSTLDPSTRRTVEVNFSSYTGTGKYILFYAPVPERTTNYNVNNFYIDDITLMAIPSCFRPTTVAAVDIANDEVTLSWVPDSRTPSPTAWLVEYGPEGFTDETAQTENVSGSDSSVTITGLTAATRYEFRVSAVCGTDVSEPRTITVTTLCNPLSLPFFEGFETTEASSSYSTAGVVPTCWEAYYNGTTAGYVPHVVTGTGSYVYRKSGANSLVMTSGAAATYGSDKYVLMPIMEDPLNIMELSFWMCTESNSYGTLTVGYLTSASDTSSFVPVQAYPASASTVHSGNGVQTTAGLEVVQNLSNLPDTAVRLAFKWGVTSSYYTCCIDDIKLDLQPTCVRARGIAISNLTHNEAVLDIDDTAHVDNYLVKLVHVGDTGVIDSTEITINTETYTFSGLLPSSQYRVELVSDCGDGTFTRVHTLTFRTDCEPLPADSLPYYEDFESYASGAANPIDPCWNKYVVGGTTNFPYPYSTNAVEGTRSLYFCGYNSTSSSPYYSYAVLPAFDTTLNSLRVSFKLRRYSTVSDYYTTQMLVGVMSNPSDINTFDTLQVIDLISELGSTIHEFEVSLADYTGTGTRIAFYAPIPTIVGSNTYRYNYVYLDSVVVSELPDCQRPTDVTISDVTAHTATVSWSADAESYTVEYADNSEFDNAMSMNAGTNNSISISGLAGYTDYYVRVKGNCGGVLSEWSFPVSFHTQMDCGPNAINIIDTIGDTTTTCAYIFYTTSSTYPMGLSTHLFSASEMLAMGLQDTNYIHSIKLHTGSTGGTIRQAKIYMTETALDAIGTPVANDTISRGSMTLVYSGDIVMTANQWVEIVFNTPFLYTASRNLALCLSRDTAATAAVTFHYTTTTPDYVSYYAYTTTSGTTSASRTIYRPDIVFNICTQIPSCPRPADVTLVGGDDTSFTIAWQGNAAGYEVMVSEAAVNPDTVTLPAAGVRLLPVSGTQIIVGGLDEQTSYYYYVRALCDNEHSTWSPEGSYTTACSPKALPYYEDFEAYNAGSTATINPCWTKGTNSTTAYPYPNNAAGYLINGQRYLYFYAYNSSSTKTYSYAALPMMQDSVKNLSLAFNVKRYNSTTASYTTRLVIGVMTNPNDIATFEPMDTIDLYNETPNSILGYEYFFNNYTGDGQYIAIYDAVPPLIGTNTTCYSYAYVDDIVVDRIPTCLRPTNVTVNNIGQHTATVHWTSTATNLQIEYGPVGFEHGQGTTVTSSVDSVDLTGLAVGTQYDVYVRAVCSATDISDWSFVSQFFTACGIMSVPYFEGFEGYGSGASMTINPCWTKNTNYSSTAYPYPLVTNAITGQRSLYFYGYHPSSGTNIYSYVALPEFDVPVNTLELSFNMRRYSTTTDYYTSLLVVGVMSNPANINTFVAIDTIDLKNTPSLSIHEIDVSFANYTGTGTHIALLAPTPPLYGSGTYTYNYSYVDDLWVDLLPPCPRAYNLTATNATATTVDLGWTDTIGSTQWKVSYALDTSATWTEVTVGSNPYTLTGLTPSTVYKFRVAPVCANGETSSWSRVTKRFTTTQQPASVPYTYDFEGADEWQNWQTSSNGATNWYRGNIVNGNSTNVMYLSADSGLTHSWSWGVNSNIVAYRDIDFGPDTADFDMSFRAYVGGSVYHNYDGVSVLLVDPSIPVQSVNTGLTSPWGNVNDLSHMTVRRDTTWATHNVTFNSVSGVRRVVFYHFNQSVNDSVIFYDKPSAIDDIHIALSPCQHPTDLTVNNITTSSARLAWNDNASDLYQICYRVQGTSSVDNIYDTVRGNSYTLLNLDNGVSYYAWVRRVCTLTATDTVVSTWSSGVSFQTLICDGGSTVDVTTATSAPGNVYLPVGSYHRHSHSQQIYLKREVGNAPTSIAGISYHYEFNTNLNGFAANIYIGHTSDSTFSAWIPVDSLQLVYSGYFNCQNGWNFFRFNTPFQYNGESNLVIVIDADSTSWSTSGYRFYVHNTGRTNATGYYTNDATDWSSSVTASKTTYRSDIRFYFCPVPCDEPVDVMVTDTAETTATLTWSESDSTEVVIMTGEWNPEAATSQTVTTGTITFTNLTGETTYIVGVRNLCPQSNSVWRTLTFTTTAHPCVMPTGLAIGNVTLDGATASWTAGEAGQTNFQVRLVSSAVAVDTIIDVQGTSYTFTGLTSGVTYNVTVRAVCAENYYSNWTAAKSFTTTDCVAPTGVTATAEGTTVTVKWRSTGADRYRVVYYKAEFTTNGTTIEVTGGDTSTVVEGLVAGESYDFYVYSYCGSNLSPASQKATVEVAGVGIALVEMSSVSLYPNPANTTVTIDGIEGQAQVTVVDMNGRVTGEWNVVNGKLTIDVSQLAKGAYFVRIAGEKAATVRKLIVR